MIVPTGVDALVDVDVAVTISVDISIGVGVGVTVPTGVGILVDVDVAVTISVDILISVDVGVAITVDVGVSSLSNSELVITSYRGIGARIGIGVPIGVGVFITVEGPERAKTGGDLLSPEDKGEFRIIAIGTATLNRNARTVGIKLTITLVIVGMP
jgi:hypothetical protein